MSYSLEDVSTLRKLAERIIGYEDRSPYHDGDRKTQAEIRLQTMMQNGVTPSEAQAYVHKLQKLEFERQQREAAEYDRNQLERAKLQRAVDAAYDTPTAL